MHSPENPDAIKSEAPHPTETTQVGGKILDVEILKPYAEKFPTKLIETASLREAVSEGHYYWEDRNGEKLGPFQILQDPEAARNNPAWADHMQTIGRANLETPIWVTEDGHVFDGMHRLTRAFLDGVKQVKAKVFSEFPEEAEVKDAT